MLRGFIFLLVSTLLIVGAAFYLMPKSENGEPQKTLADEGFLRSEKELNDRREDYLRRKSELAIQIKRFESRKNGLVNELKEMGISNAADLDSNKDAKRKYKDILADEKDIAKFNTDIALFDEAVSAIDDALRDIDRQKLRDNVALTNDALGQLRTTILDIDSRLNKPETGMESLETQENLQRMLK